MTQARDQATGNKEIVRRIFEVVLPDPDASVEFADFVAEHDLVAMRWSAGPAEAMVWFRLREGKLTDRWAMVRH